MPLSEHEQRLLDQLEKQLNAEDPSFVSSMSSAPLAQFSIRNLVLGVLITIIGMGVLIAGVASKLIILGILGFIIAAAGAYYATAQRSGGQGKAKSQKNTGDFSAKASSAPKKQSSFMQGLEDKWEERRHRGY